MTGAPPLYRPAEGRPHQERLRDQEALLRAVLARAVDTSPAVRAALAAAGLAPGAIRLDDLVRLPLVRKEQLPALQAGARPFGGWLGQRVEELRRIFVSPGPIYDPEGAAADYWGFAPALHAAGFRRGDLVLNTFSYHFTPAGAMFDGALQALGCVTIPSGVGNLELQVQTVLDLQAVGFIGTPSFLAALLGKLQEAGGGIPLRVAMVSGEPLPEPLRADLEGRAGIAISQAYAIGDLGLIAYECPHRRGLHLADRVIAELVDPHSGAPVAEGAAGEVAVTFLSDVYPLLRLATGDLSRLAPGACPCGRTAPRLERILGRVGDAVKVRGLFIHPHELDRALARHPEVRRYQAVVTRPGHEDVLTIRIESEAPDPAALAAAVAQSVREGTRLRAAVEVVAPGAIGPQAKTIEDRRRWD